MIYGGLSGFFIFFAIMAGAMCIFQLLFLLKLRVIAIYLLPILSFCIAYENAVLARGSRDDELSPTNIVAYICHSCIIPCFVIIFNETNLSVHKARQLNFIFVPYDMNEEDVRIPELICLWVSRLIAASLLVMTLLVNFRITDADSKDNNVGEGGYTSWSDDSSMAMALSLVPHIFLGLWALGHTYMMSRYGSKMTLALEGNAYWKLPLPCAVLYCVSIIFADTIYPIFSNAGELVLLLGLSFAVYLDQNDLKTVSSFADFLHRSNAAFATSKAIKLMDSDGRRTGDDVGGNGVLSMNRAVSAKV